MCAAPWLICHGRSERAREKTNYGPMKLQFQTGRHRSTIWKVLHRHGMSRRSERPQTTRR
jgi:hypothetical protein